MGYVGSWLMLNVLISISIIIVTLLIPLTILTILRCHYYSRHYTTLYYTILYYTILYETVKEARAMNISRHYVGYMGSWLMLNVLISISIVAHAKCCSISNI